MKGKRQHALRFAIIMALSASALGQVNPAATDLAALRVRIESSLPGRHRSVPAVIWLDPEPGDPAPPVMPHGRYTLLQKNRTFIPHLQVIPVDSVVQFPNQDPFFHNVFSLFDGKRFDLGLYEAGSTKSVTFSRIGVSYIFCNIHPEMSAVIIALATPYYAIASSNGAFLLRSIVPGDYTLHVWIEGVPQSQLDHYIRPVHLPPHAVDLGVIQAPVPRVSGLKHDNMYGNAYPPPTQSPY